MQKIKYNVIQKICPYIYSFLYSTLLFPMYFGNWFSLESLIIVFSMIVLIYNVVKYWIKQNNYVFLLISGLLLISYCLKYAYIYFLISIKSTYLIDGIFDYQQTNYLYINSVSFINL